MRIQACHVALAAALLCCGTAAAASWNTARWQAAYIAIPPPPDSLEHAARMIGPVRDDNGNLNLGIVDPALLKSHADVQAGLAAIERSSASGQALNQGAQAAGIALARKHRDPAYGQQKSRGENTRVSTRRH